MGDATERSEIFVAENDSKTLQMWVVHSSENTMCVTIIEMEKILVFDLETTNLRANQGYLLCFGYKWLHQSKAKVLSITDFKRDEIWDDSRLLTEATAIYSEADIVVTWYGKRFDVPFFDTRLLLHKRNPIERKPHIDLWETCRYKLSFTSNRLETVGGSLPLGPGETKHWKVPVDNWTWVTAGCGDEKSIRKIRFRCKEDVYLTEAAYYKLRSRVDKHPNISLIRSYERPKDIPNCSTCGDDRFHVRQRVTAKTRYLAVQCQGCGHIDKRSTK